MTIAEQLLQNKTDLDEINEAVCDQADLITQIKTSLDNLPEPSPVAIFSVAKQVSDDPSTYPDDLFILLDIYPESLGEVKITYGGVTKTIVDTTGAVVPNAQQVVFGTLLNNSDGVTTPDSGTVTIQGAYRGFGCGTYAIEKNSTHYAGCITSVTDFGKSTFIPHSAFRNCPITSINISPRINLIEGYAFSGSALTSFRPPKHNLTYGTCVFYNCPSLKSIYIDDLVTAINNVSFNEYEGWNAFSNGATLYLNGEACTDLVIPSGISSIPKGYFEGGNLTSVTFSAVIPIGSAAFRNCTNLHTVTFNGTSGVTVTIGSCAFLGCSSLTSIVFPNGVGYLDYGVLKGCTSLTNVVLPNTIVHCDDSFIEPDDSPNLQYFVEDSLCYIGSPANPYVYLAKNIDESLSTYNIKAGTKIISSNAFIRCFNIVSLTFPRSVTHMYFNFNGPFDSLNDLYFENFGGLDYLEGIDIPGVNIHMESLNIEKWCSLGEKFNFATSDYAYLYVGDTQVQDLVIPMGVSSVPNYAFSHSYFGDFVISDSVTKLGSGCFYHGLCGNGSDGANDSFHISKNLKAIPYNTFMLFDFGHALVIPDNITQIGEQAFASTTFYENRSETIVIGSGVTTIGLNAFSGLRLMVWHDFTTPANNTITIKLRSTTPPTLSGSVFSADTANTTSPCSLVFVVPYGCGDAYKSAQYWSDYADRIIEGDVTV